MLPYWLLWIMFGAGAIARGGKVVGRLTMPLVLATVCLTLFVGLRWEVGPDWVAYEHIFARYRNADLATAVMQTDPAFYLLVWTVNALNLPFWALNLVCATFLSFGLLAFCRRQPKPWLAFAVAVPYLVIVIGMSATRQATALGFVFFALSLLGRRSLAQVLVWIFVGALFHASASIVGLLVAASYTKNRLHSAALIMVTAVPAYYVLFSAFDEYITRYSQTDIDSTGVWVRVVMNAIPALALLIFKGRFGISPDEVPFWRNLAILSLLLIPAGYVFESTTAVDRVSLYAIPLQLLVLSRIPQAFSRSSSTSSVWTGGIVSYSALTLAVYLLMSSHARYYLPYKFIPLA